MSEVTFTGVSGLRYRYGFVMPVPGTMWLQFPGNYGFVRLAHIVLPLYFGETDNLANRPMPPFHERWAEAVRDYGATHLVTHLTLGHESVRKAEERDLIAAYNPPMNTQHRTGIAGTRAARTGAQILGRGLLTNRGIV